jgi:hypothetical protein
MKKLVLVIAITSLLAIGALAASYTLTPSLSVSGSYSFGFVLNGKGLDLTHGFGSDLSVSAAWSNNFPGIFTTGATWTANLGISMDWGSAPSIYFNSLVYESAVSKLTFEEAYARGFCGLMWKNGSAAGFTYVYKPLSALTLQYLDTTADGATTSPSTPLFAMPYFKDELAANYKGTGYSVTGALYYDNMSNAVYDYFAGLNYTGITGLTVLAAFGSDLQRTAAPAASETGTWLPVATAADPVTQMGLDAKYTKDFGLNAMGTVTLNAEYKYFKDFTPKYEAFTDTDGDGNADTPTFPVNANNAYGKLAYTGTFGMFTVNPWIEGTYDILNATQTADFGVSANAKFAAGPVNITPSVDVEGNVIPAFGLTTKTLDIALDSTFGQVSLAGDVNWADFMNMANPTWNAKATYSNAPWTLEGYVTSTTTGPAYAGYYAMAKYAANIWTYTAFFGTLSQDSNGAYTVVNPAYWYIQAAATVSF